MKKIKDWFYKPAFTLICYVIALILFMYFIYVFKLSYQSVSSYIEAGTLSWTTNFSDISTYIMSNTFSYFFYVAAFVFFGKVISIIKPRTPKEEVIDNKFEEIIEEGNEELVEA